TDLSPTEMKWRSFQALARMNNLMAGEDAAALPSTADIIGTAYLVCPDHEERRLTLLFEDRLTAAATHPAQHGVGLLRGLRLLATERATDLSDGDQTWNVFMALAAAQMTAPPDAEDGRLRPSVDETFVAAFRELPRDLHGAVALRFEDNLVT